MAWRRGDRGPEVAAIRATLAGMGLLHNIDSVGVTEPETGSVLARTDAVFDAEVVIDATKLAPFVTWGTNPGQGVPLGGVVPAVEDFEDEVARNAASRALKYMDLTPGTNARHRH